MTIQKISKEQNCRINTVIQNLQDGGVFRKQDSREMEDQTVNQNYEEDITPITSAKKDFYWNGNTVAGRKITAIARGL